jgi:hypothetical protein
MKRFFYLLLAILPSTPYAQQIGNKISPSDNMWMNVGNAGFSEGMVFYTSLAFSPDGEPYVVYEDYSNSYKATVKRFDGFSWIDVGPSGFTDGEVEFTGLAFTQSGQPIVSYIDVSDSGKVSAMTYDGSNWVYMGNRGFSPSPVDFVNLAINSNNQPFVAFRDLGQDGKVTVMKYDGTNWIIIGNRGFTESDSWYCDLAIDSLNQPYVVYQDWIHSGKASVMRFDGADWVYVGPSGFTPKQASYTSIAMSPAGEPFVAFRNGSEVELAKATVMKFDGSDWIFIGTQDFSAGEVYFTDIAINLFGEPFVAFKDGGNSYKATVMKFNGTSWQNVGTPGFSPGAVFSTSLAFDNSYYPYVAFVDDSDTSNGKASVMKFDSVFVGYFESQYNSVSVSPNPAGNIISIESPESGELALLDLRSQVMMTCPFTHPKMQIDISALPDGMYVLKLVSGNGVRVGKVIKE